MKDKHLTLLGQITLNPNQQVYVLMLYRFVLRREATIQKCDSGTRKDISWSVTEYMKEKNVCSNRPSGG